MDLPRLGRELRERRKALGIPRSELARRVGVTPTYIWLLEEARPRKGGEPSRPSEDLLRRWIRALGLDTPYAGQALTMAGYLPVEPSTAVQTPMHRARFHTSLASSAEHPSASNLPQALFHRQARPAASMPDERASVLRESAPPEEAAEPSAFATAPVSYPPSHTMQQDLLVDRLGRLLQLAEDTGNWEETSGLIESLLDWLSYRLREDER